MEFFLGIVRLLVLQCLLTMKQIIATENYHIKENINPGTVVGNVKTYLQSHGCSDSSISLMNYKLSDLFQLNKHGDLLVNKKIDRESICPEKMTTDLYSEQICKVKLEIYCDTVFDKFPVDIIIRDENDQAPFWGYRSRDFNIKENSNDAISLPLAKDNDSGKNGRINYKLLLGNEPAHFSLNEEDGKLKLMTTHVIDRETKEKYTLYLVATDQGEPSKSTTLTLSIMVEDANDNDPVFTQQEYSLSALSETTPINSEILTLKATDKDSGLYGRLIFDFSKSEEHSLAKKYFRISHDGKVIVNKPLDYDNGPNLFRFKVTARDTPDSNSEFRSAEASVVIALQDENDEKPEIIVSYPGNSQTIKENEDSDRPCAFIRVHDKDYKGQDTIKCHLHNNNFRLVDRKSLNGGYEYKLRALTSFDREQSDKQNVDIICTDVAGNTAIKNISFTIEDQNDQSPEFIKDIRLQIKENMRVGSVVDGRIIARDNDTYKNAEILFEIANKPNLDFDIAPSLGIITSKREFDREKEATILLNILAIDQGVPKRTSSMSFTVTILDENDHPPTFKEPLKTFDILENSYRPHEVIAHVEAEDLDEGRNAEIKYDLLRDEESLFFRISPEDGKITVIKELDRETKSKYLLKVRAFNPHHSISKQTISGGTTTTTVTINVLDVNDNRPVFVYPNITHKSVEVTNTVQGGLIAVIQAKDKDFGKNSTIKYTMNSNSPPIPFSLDGGSGTLYIDGKINGNIAATYLVNFRACDQGEPPLCEDYRNFRINIRKTSINSPHYTEGGTSPAMGNEPIIICLAVIFIILVLATIILVFLIRRKIYWLNNHRTRKNTVPEISAPHTVKSGIPLNTNGDQTYKDQDRKFEEEAFLQMNSNKFYTVDERTKRKKSNFNEFTRADYQTLDGLYLTSSNPATGATLRYTCEPPTYYEIAGNQIISQPSYEQCGTQAHDNFILQSSTVPQNLSSSNVLQKLGDEETGTVDIPLNCPGSLKHSSFKSDKNLCPTSTLTPHSKHKYGYAAYSEASFV